MGSVDLVPWRVGDIFYLVGDNALCALLDIFLLIKNCNHIKGNKKLYEYFEILYNLYIYI